MTTATIVDPDRQWADAAINSELEKLANLPEEKIQKPGSVFSISLLKIASIIKGSGKMISPSEALGMISQTCGRYEWMQQKEVERQWQRAYNNAHPRYRQPSVNGSSPGAANGKTANPAPRPGKPAPAAPTPVGEIDVKNPKTKDYYRGFELLDYQFRMNELDDSIEVNRERLTGGQQAVIVNRMRDIGLNASTWVERAITQAAYENSYHPVKEYLNSLEWDEKDWIGWFCEHFWSEATGMGHTALLRWLIGAVAKVMEKGQNFMLVLDGPQGIGKSTFSRWLCPLPTYFIEGAINPANNDDNLRLMTKLIWEVSELQATTRKADREALKGFISRQEVTARRPYAALDLVKPALASFIGTINEDGAGFLADPTGNRRFVIINIQTLKWEYLQQDVTNLWAQAVALYRSGYPWELTPEEKQRQREIQLSYETQSYVALKFFDHFVYEPESDRHTSMDDIIRTIEADGLKGSQQANMNELGRILKRLGAVRMRVREGNKRPTVYKGVYNA